MKKKILTIFLAMLVTLQTVSFTFAVTSNELLQKLNEVSAKVSDMKEEYNDILNTYPDVINSLSAENKENAKNLANNIMADNAKANLDAIKQELSASSVANADKVLAAINKLENEAKDLVEDNKDVIEEVKTGYVDMSTTEIKEVVEKVKEIAVSLGVSADTTATYNELMNVLNTAHTKALNINTKIENVITDNVDTFEEALTLDILKELVQEVKNKDQEAVIDTLKEAIKDLSNVDGLKASLEDIKNDVKSLKTELSKLNNLDEQKLLMFTDVQKQAVSNKFKTVEQDYVTFAKKILHNNAKDYIKVTMNLARTDSVDNMIRYANEVMDYIIEYRDTVNSLTKQDVLASIQNRINLPQETVKKAGMLVALEFIDVTPYNKNYIENNFGAEINELLEYIATEFVNYLDYVDLTMQNEVKDTISKYNENIAQEKVKTINAQRFTTLANIKTLKTRIEREFLNDKDDVKANLATVASYVYDIYHTNILNTIEKIMSLEGEKSNKKYEFNSARFYIVADNFMNKNTVAGTLGIPDGYQDTISYTKLNGSNVKTGTKMTIALSSSVYQTYTYVILGDVYADGKVNAKDYMAIKNQIMGIDNLSNVSKTAANTYRDNKINAKDYMAIKNQIMGIDNISL